MERLDKIISRELNITRTQAKSLIKSGAVSVDNKPVKNSDFKTDSGDIAVNGQAVENNKFVYIMMNKPKGVISASEGRGEKTVVDLLPDEMKRRGLFPAGRLDRDTTGFVLLTDDGAFAHSILSPSRHVDKTYVARLDKPFDSALAEDFKSGMSLDGEKLLSAEISPVNGDYQTALVVLRQGLYHQVKRMFKKHGITVTELKRIKIGALELDASLGEGECRYLTPAELKRLSEKG